jgi:hypothetical protein
MNLANLLGKYMDRQQAGGDTNPGYQHVGGDVMVHRDFDEVARRAPRSALAEGLAAAFRSTEARPFGQALAHLFSQAGPEVRAGILGRLLTIAPDSIRGDLAGLFSRNRDVRPEDAARVKPELVRQVAEEARRKDDGIVDRIADYLAEHPSLLKNLDITTLASAMARIGERLQPRTMTGGGGAG